jgi:hypothetical protein
MNKDDAIRLSGIVQTVNATLDFMRAKVSEFADGEDARRLRHLIGEAMFSLAEFSAELHVMNIGSISPEMRPPNLKSEEEIRVWAERMRDSFRNRSR